MVDYTLVGTQAGNMGDTGTVVEMESLYLQCVAYNNLNYVHMEMWEWYIWGEANFLLGT